MDFYENCNITNQTETFIATLLYAGISFLSFVILIHVVLLSLVVYIKRRVIIEYMEGLFMTLSVLLMMLTLNESFQWVIFCSSIACQVIGFIREYCLIALLTNTMCISFHLLLHMCPPKCLQVIVETRQRRSKMLAIIYLLCAFMVPLLFVFWPFFISYGIDQQYCWISNDFPNSWYIKVLLWHAWAPLACCFALLVSVVVIVRICLHTAKCNADTFPLMLLMAGFLYAVIINALSALLVRWSYLSSTGSLTYIFSSIVLLTRAVYNICYKQTVVSPHTKVIKGMYKAVHTKSSATPLIETPYSNVQA